MMHWQCAALLARPPPRLWARTALFLKAAAWKVCRGFWDRLLDIEAKTIEF